MSLIPTVTCRRCGYEYKATSRRCPNCGTRRVQQSGRTPAGTPSTVKGTAANGRASMNARWQMIFGIVLVLAIILAVIVMVTVSLNGEDATPVATPTPSASSQAGATPTPTATPTPSESIQVTSVTIAYYDEPRTEFGVTIGGSPTPVTAKVYPVDVEAEVKWSVKEGGEDIISISVDDDGTCEVEGIGSGSAVLVAECGGVSAECTVFSG